MKLQLYNKEGRFPGSGLPDGDNFQDTREATDAGIFGLGQDQHSGDGVYVDPRAVGGRHSWTLVRIEHCGRQHVIELSRREWVAVACGRAVAGPPCTACRAPIPLPLTREHGRVALGAEVREVWGVRVQQLRLGAAAVSFPALLSLPLSALGGAFGGMAVHARFFAGRALDFSMGAAAGGAIALLLWLLVWLLLRRRARKEAEREAAVAALAGPSEFGDLWVPTGRR